MLDCVAGMDEVETILGESHILDARAHEFGTLQTLGALCNPLIRFDTGERRLRRGGQKRVGKRAAIGADIECSQGPAKIGMKPRERKTSVGTEAFAVADIAPIRTRGNGSAAAWRAIDARKTLHETAVPTHMNFKTAAAAGRFVDFFKRGVAAKIACFGHRIGPLTGD